MAEDDWSESLPRALKMRFDGIANYVVAVLDESRLRKGLSSVDVQQIQISAFIKTLNEFLVDGTQAAIRAVDAFSELNLDGFKVGAELFEGRNEAVTRGQRLSTSLREAMPDGFGDEVVANSWSLREMIVSMAKEARRARGMG